MAQAGSAVHLASVRKGSERAEPTQLAPAGLETPAQSFPGRWERKDLDSKKERKQ